MILCFFALPVNAQIQYDDDALDSLKIREIGINMTPMVGNFISIGQTAIENQGVALFYKAQRKKGRFFRLGLGFNFASDFFSDVAEMQVSMGIEKQRWITSKWKYWWGFDVVLSVDENVDLSREIGSGFGVGPVFGVKYYLNPKISLGTESTMYFIAGDGVNFKFNPPLSLFLNVNFEKNRSKLYERFRLKR